MTFQAKLLRIVELAEWMPSYPGDPLVRPTSYSIEFMTNDVMALDDWMITACGDKFTRISDEQMRTYPKSWDGTEVRIDQWLVVYEFTNKNDFLIVKLAWHGR